MTLGRGTDGQAAAPLGVFGVAAANDRLLVGVPMGTRGVPLVFTSSGRFVRTIGRLGRGPGEFIAARTILRWRGDSVLVADPVLGRFSVLSPSLQYIRSLPVRIPSFESVIALSNGDLLVNVSLADRKVIGYPFHVITADGHRRHSFGSERPVISPERLHEMARLIARGENVVWSATPFGRYAIDGWEIETGSLQRRILREADFYREGPRRAPTPDQPPSSAITGLLVDESFLWVLAAVPSPQWHRGLGRKPIRGEGGGLQYRIEDVHLVYDTMVEVFDTRSGKLYASGRFEEFMSVPFADARLALWREETADGNVVTHAARFNVADGGAP